MDFEIVTDYWLLASRARGVAIAAIAFFKNGETGWIRSTGKGYRGIPVSFLRALRGEFGSGFIENMHGSTLTTKSTNFTKEDNRFMKPAFIVRIVVGEAIKVQPHSRSPYFSQGKKVE